MQVHYLPAQRNSNNSYRSKTSCAQDCPRLGWKVDRPLADLPLKSVQFHIEYMAPQPWAEHGSPLLQLDWRLQVVWLQLDQRPLQTPETLLL